MNLNWISSDELSHFFIFLPLIFLPIKIQSTILEKQITPTFHFTLDILSTYLDFK